jgi:predicted AAA+ superfamily ATPase
MDPALLATLRTYNPWLDRPGDQPALLAASLPASFVPRRRRLELRPGRAELVVGPRQAGKSTWIREVLTHFEAPVLVLHAEEPRIRELAHSPALALDALTEVLSPDNGLRNAVFGGFKASPERADRGALWEYAIFNELAKRLELLDEIGYWRSKSGAEVDFVVRRGERMVAIEVKAGDLPRPVVSRGTHSFLEAYRPACLGVVNASLRLDTVEDGVPVRFVRPWELDVVLDGLEG